MKKKFLKKFVSICLTASISVSFFSFLAFADTSTADHIGSGGLSASVVQNLAYTVSNPTTNTTTSMMNNGVIAWNGISSRVNLVNSSSNTKLKVYTATSSNPGEFGELFAYDSWNIRCVTFWSSWDHCDIKLYDNQMNNSNLTPAQRTGVIMHETGHALSMKHTNGDNEDEIMDSMAVPNTQLYDFDKWHLRCKWGW